MWPYLQPIHPKIHCLSTLMISYWVMLLLRVRFRNDSVFVNHFVITICIGRSSSINYEHPKGILQCLNHLNWRLCCSELCEKGTCFHWWLPLYLPMHWRPVDKYQSTYLTPPILMVTGVVFTHKTRPWRVPWIHACWEVIPPWHLNKSQKKLISIPFFLS